MTETLIKDSIYKVLSLFKPYGDLFEVCQTPGKYIPRLICITVTNFQATTVYWRRKKKRTFLTKNIGSRKILVFEKRMMFVMDSKSDIFRPKIGLKTIENQSKSA